MRVTQNMLAGNSLRNLSASFAKMGKYQDQLATGKKISRPSDDPVVAMKGMYNRTSLTEIEQYQRNLTEGYTWMENTESALEQTNDGLQRARELLIQGKNGTLTEQDQKAVAREIEQIKNDIVQVANTRVAGKFIFNGTDILNSPVDATGGPNGAPLVKSNNEDFAVEVSKGIRLKVNINPQGVYSQDLFNTLHSLQQKLDGDATVIDDFDQLLSKLDTEINKGLQERSELGARYNRLEMVDNRLRQQEVVATKMISDNEDADIERVITDLTSQESVHRAALSVGARIIQPSLMDFLR